MARGKKVDRELAELVLKMKARNPKLTTDQIGAATNCDASTAGRIIKGGSWEGYCAIKEDKARKGRERIRKAAEEQQEAAEVQVPGQLRMALDPEEEILEEKPGMSDQVKMMRFQAAQVDKICMKLDRLNDSVMMLLRAVRRE